MEDSFVVFCLAMCFFKSVFLVKSKDVDYGFFWGSGLSFLYVVLKF